jgi:multicomponent Na+:H+ antiporter subunit C
MTSGMLFAIIGGALFAMGAGGVLLHEHLLRRILAFNVMGSGAFLVLVGLAQRDGAADPVPQAMVLTGIVVSVAATALALALALLRRLHALDGRTDLSSPDGDGDGDA